ncbi:MAG: hypothetical protein F4190_02835 [Acidimicrobiales bacterium]|nr:hypothetical protein [Acidimicrobiales bacterium]MYI27986.1 hypothetical protein [Acidimicrobiales bacterium]
MGKSPSSSPYARDPMTEGTQHPIWQESGDDPEREFVAFTAAVLITLRSALAVAWDDLPDIVDDIKRAIDNPDLPEELMVLSPTLKQRVRERVNECVEHLEKMPTSSDLFPADDFLVDEFGAFVWRLNLG